MPGEGGRANGTAAVWGRTGRLHLGCSVKGHSVSLLHSLSRPGIQGPFEKRTPTCSTSRSQTSIHWNIELNLIFSAPHRSSEAVILRLMLSSHNIPSDHFPSYYAWLSDHFPSYYAWLPDHFPSYYAWFRSSRTKVKSAEREQESESSFSSRGGCKTNH